MTQPDRTPLATAFLPRLKQALEATPAPALLDCLGYRGSSRERALKRIEGLREAGDLFAWLRQPGYDFHYTQAAFFLALADCLAGIEREEAEAVLAEARREQARLDGLYPSWIHVDTGPVRPTHPFIAMASTGTARFIRLDPQAVRDDFCEELERVRHIIRAHYRRFDGVILLWGRIRKYDWHFGKGQVLCLSPEGEVLTGEAPDSQEGRASISVK